MIILSLFFRLEIAFLLNVDLSAVFCKQSFKPLYTYLPVSKFLTEFALQNFGNFLCFKLSNVYDFKN